MPSVELRKRVIVVEEIFHEGGPVAQTPYRRAAILAVIKNPFAGRYVEEIVGFSDDLKPLGLEMAKALIAALGGDPKAIEGYGKGAIVGAAGEIEHGALWHAPGRLCDARGARRREGDRALGQEGRRPRRAARRADHPYQRLLCAQPFRRDRGRHRRRAARRRDAARAGDDDRPARP